MKRTCPICECKDSKDFNSRLLNIISGPGIIYIECPCCHTKYFYFKHYWITMLPIEPNKYKDISKSFTRKGWTVFLDKNSLQPINFNCYGSSIRNIISGIKCNFEPIFKEKYPYIDINKDVYIYAGSNDKIINPNNNIGIHYKGTPFMIIGINGVNYIDT